MATSDHHAFPLPGRGNKFFNHLQETATSKATPSLKDIKPLIDEVLTYLETATTTDVMTKAVADALFTLEQIPGFLMNESFSTIVEIDTTKLTFIQHKVGQYLLQNGFAKITVTIARSLQDTASYITGTQLQAQCQYNLYLLYMLVLRYTHVYPVTDASFCSSICKEGILDTLKLSLIYLNDTANKLPLYLDGYNLLIRTTIVVLGVLFNCIAFCSENKYLYRQAKIVDTLSTITRVDNDINLLVLLTVAYVVEEAESNDMLLNSQYTIQYVIELLKKAVYSANHFVVTKSGIFASSSRHLLHGLNYLALNNDVNKRIILKYGGLPAIIRMLQPIFSEEEIQLATKTLRSLAGVDTIRKEIEGQLHKSGVSSSILLLDPSTAGSNTRISDGDNVDVFDRPKNDASASNWLQDANELTEFCSFTRGNSSEEVAEHQGSTSEDVSKDDGEEGSKLGLETLFKITKTFQNLFK